MAHLENMACPMYASLHLASESYILILSVRAGDLMSKLISPVLLALSQINQTQGGHMGTSDL